ncbi:MAG: DsbA family protein [Staphylococcus equorum]|uniref:DsbA family protein n=1 Tax=Staphylococcus TaxID=1279 RepID=UPI000852A8C4|nr:DsbA family protein [Staphylococcus equorum]MDG0837045.1 DsbA family protein [Staphylococcus equorum]MDK9871636.1 DsbA family protein [Staphylococcus equorum]MDK9877793.1 DsbA family protein [Staphylococcus equorum]MDN5828657.1 DsbA family protein [Staphylococcus equorum]MDN6611457.1 DsbA family protein [Staphylococcus equorum]
MEKNMVCDMYSGICKPSEENEIETINFDVSAPNLTLYYVTDPMCSHCWAFEPTLNKLLVQYGHLFNFQMVMGGLLEAWGDGPIDPANGIYKPADVTPHWQEVGNYSRMPIDGTIMEIDPVQSSFPASRLYKAIQHVDSPTAAIKFTRLVREAVFVFNKNISDKAVLKHIVEDLYKGDNTIDVDSILNIADSDIGQNLLAEDFNLVSQLGVRGFPTIVIVNKDNQGTKIVGARSLETYIDALEKLDTSITIEPNRLPKLSLYLNEQSSLFSKEIEVMYDIEEKDVPNFIEKDLDKSKYTISNILGESYYEVK